MPAKPEVQSLLDLINAQDMPPLAEQPLEQVRENYDRMATLSGEDVASTSDHMVESGVHGDFAIRVYRPAGSSEADTLPVLVWFHGGGFAIGSIATSDSTARALANAAHVAVASVGYHLAPEHPYPAAVDDAVAALDWVVTNSPELGIDSNRIAVGGDSAGGNLAAVVCQLAKAAKRPRLTFQLLVYPVTDLAGEQPSMTENATGKLLTKELMDWFAKQYLGGRDGSNPRVSPLRASDLSDLPPALVITAELDPLRDEGEAYAAALAAAGVPTELIRYDGEIHGFFGLDFLPDCADARSRAGRALRSAL